MQTKVNKIKQAEELLREYDAKPRESGRVPWLMGKMLIGRASAMRLIAAIVGPFKDVRAGDELAFTSSGGRYVRIVRVTKRTSSQIQTSEGCFDLEGGSIPRGLGRLSHATAELRAEAQAQLDKRKRDAAAHKG